LPQPSDENQKSRKYNTRLQKGGALIEEMRQLVRFWATGSSKKVEEAAIRDNVLNKTTRARSADILRRTFKPRFVEGPIPNAWKIVRPLEDIGASPQVVRPVYYWISATAEPMIADFVREFLLQRAAMAHVGIEQSEVLAWLRTKACGWSPTVSIKVARGLLAALRDFGILEGRVQKRLASFRLPISSFAYIAFCLQQLGNYGSQIAFHDDWSLFLLSIREVEQLFFEAHQRHLLEYHAAGNTVSLTFPCETVEEYAHVVIARSN